MTHFIQQCPTCGRRLQVKLAYLGKKVACQHCQAPFIAQDSSFVLPATQTTPTAAFKKAEVPEWDSVDDEEIESILSKADQYLSSTDLGAEIFASHEEN
ncbi:MAG: hypothetical protein ACKVH8_06135 [Pirellulales bacterium]